MMAGGSCRSISPWRNGLLSISRQGTGFSHGVPSPTVIFGRNQNIEAEVDIDYCRRNGIGFYRRKSGGGCVYADMDNIMMSYITASGDDVQTIFSRYTSMIAGMLSSLGLEASATGRNDVYIGTRKVSGNAFYRLPGRSIVHGTMLFSTDMGHMLRAITPSRSKMESKQVQSVAAHVTTISEHLPELNIDDFEAPCRFGAYQWRPVGANAITGGADREYGARIPFGGMD